MIDPYLDYFKQLTKDLSFQADGEQFPLWIEAYTFPNPVTAWSLGDNDYFDSTAFLKLLRPNKPLELISYYDGKNPDRAIALDDWVSNLAGATESYKPGQETLLKQSVESWLAINPLNRWWFVAAAIKLLVREFRIIESRTPLEGKETSIITYRTIALNFGEPEFLCITAADKQQYLLRENESSGTLFSGPIATESLVSLNAAALKTVADFRGLEFLPSNLVGFSQQAVVVNVALDLDRGNQPVAVAVIAAEVLPSSLIRTVRLAGIGEIDAGDGLAIMADSTVEEDNSNSGTLQTLSQKALLKGLKGKVKISVYVDSIRSLEGQSQINEVIFLVN